MSPSIGYLFCLNIPGRVPSVQPVWLCCTGACTETPGKFADLFIPFKQGHSQPWLRQDTSSALVILHSGWHFALDKSPCPADRDRFRRLASARECVGAGGRRRGMMTSGG